MRLTGTVGMVGQSDRVRIVTMRDRPLASITKIQGMDRW